MATVEFAVKFMVEQGWHPVGAQTSERSARNISVKNAVRFVKRQTSPAGVQLMFARGEQTGTVQFVKQCGVWFAVACMCGPGDFGMAVNQCRSAFGRKNNLVFKPH